ncbi:ComEC/Rec2 family competence protein [Parafrigoribacterium soli]|uniref:ComEC/Rec2 family competence protein n=1 Tax=Parafrigoribacterium soli TaxID=3144663 RepID=UPI0032ED29E0
MSVDLRLALPVAAAWVTVAVLLTIPSLLALASIVAWLLAGLCATVAVLRRGRTGFSLLALVVVAAASSGLVLGVAAGQLATRSPSALLQAASAGRFVHGLAVTTQTVQPGTARFTATLESVTIGGRQRAVMAPVTVFASKDPSPGTRGGSRLAIGSTVLLQGTVAAAEAGDDVAFLFFSARPASLRSGPPWYLGWADGLRARFADAAAALPGDGGGLLPGLAIGDTSAVNPTLSAAMKSSSLSHLTAVSGANCAVIIALIMAAGAALGLPRGWRLAAAVVTLVGFVVLVTPQPSVLRAAVMAALVLAAMGSGRPVRGLPVLALAVLGLLVADPWLARSYGFVLSVLATGGLLLLARPLAAMLSRWLPTALAVVIAVPLAAQLACQPVLILLNPSIPLYAVPANVLAEPAAPVATVLGLVACVLMPWLPGPGILVARLAWLPSSWIAGVARFFDSLPGKSIPWPAGAAGVALVSGAIALGLVVVLLRAAQRRRWRRLAALALTLLLVGYAGVAAGDRLRQTLMRPQDWQIAACDIGQGDAVLVRSAGRVALIDTGPDPALLHHCLDVLGIGRIDLLVLTHYDLDHVGGTSAVIGMVDRAMIGPPADAHDTRLAAAVRRGGATVDQVSRGETGELGELRWSVLWPPTRSGIVEPGNDSSVTLEFTGVGACASGCISSLFLGDLGNEPQARMLAANRGLGHVDVVKVAHHGSADQNPVLYERIAATVGLISVGANNRYGHPTDYLLQILARVGTIAERTDRQGMVLVSPRPDGGLSVWSERTRRSGTG